MFLPTWGAVMALPLLARAGASSDEFIGQLFRLLLVYGLLMAFWVDAREYGVPAEKKPMALPLAILAFGATIPVLWGIQAVVAALPVDRPVPLELPEFSVQTALLLFVAVISEEVFFRCLAPQLLTEAGLPKLAATVISALAFGLSHFGGGPAMVLIAFLSGLWLHLVIHLFEGLRPLLPDGMDASLPLGMLPVVLLHFAFNYLALLKIIAI